ncbi:hypothetical protein TSOC_015358, partial [Tetrabaena socialis]
GARERHGAHPGDGHQPRHHAHPRHAVPLAARGAHRPAGPPAHHLHRALQRKGDPPHPGHQVRGGGRGDVGGRQGAADQDWLRDQPALQHPAHHRCAHRVPAAQGRGGGHRGHQQGVQHVRGREAQHAVPDRVPGAVHVQRSAGGGAGGGDGD